MGSEQRSRGAGAYIKGDSFKVVFKYSRLSLSCIEKKKKKSKSVIRPWAGEKKERHVNKTKTRQPKYIVTEGAS